MRLFPYPEALGDFFDYVRLLKKSDDPHRSSGLWTSNRVCFVIRPIHPTPSAGLYPDSLFPEPLQLSVNHVCQGEESREMFLTKVK